MKTVLIAVLMACAGTVQATPLDIGPAGKTFSRNFAFGQLNGVQMNGQSLSFDLNFNNSVHLFAGTYPTFELGLGFLTTGTTNPGAASGTGFVLDSAGNQMCAARRLGSATSDHGEIFLGLFPIFPVATDLTRPFTFYGVHYDITLPDSGFFILDGGFSLWADEFTRHHKSTQPFRIGPHVPDNGSTFLLFGVGIVALWLGRFDRMVKQAVKEGN